MTPDPRVDCTVALVICTLGDVLLDVIVRTSEPLAPGADSPVETRLATGGQAANVAAWVAELGERARCVAKQADDAAGTLARTLLERRGVELAGPVVAGTTGTVVALVSPGETLGSLLIGAVILRAMPSPREAAGAALVIVGCMLTIPWARGESPAP